MNKTTEALKLSLPALENAESVAASINAGKRHAIQVDEETCFWQREEWVRWAIDEVLPEIRQALAAIREALADHVEQNLTMVAEHKCGGCAKTAADGWALYCVECWEKAEPMNVDAVNTSGKRVDETVNNRHEPVKQEPVAWTNYNGAVNNRLKGAPVRPVKQEPVAYLCGGYIDNFPTGRYETCEATDYGAFPVYAAPVQPVKQEPVAWHEPNAYGNVTTHKKWAEENGWLPLYTKE